MAFEIHASWGFNLKKINVNLSVSLKEALKLGFGFKLVGIRMRIIILSGLYPAYQLLNCS
jgi:hypothetical protein